MIIVIDLFCIYLFYELVLEKLSLENIRRAEQRWTERKNHINQSNDEPMEYKRQTSNTFITWNILWYNNLLFSKCENHNIIIIY